MHSLGEAVRDHLAAGAAAAHRHRLVRRVLAVRGEMRFVVDVTPRFDYARAGHEATSAPHGALFRSPDLELSLATRCPLEIIEGRDVRARIALRAGETASFVLERTEQTTKLHEIDLAGATNIAGSKWDDVATKPSLEQSEAAAVGIKPVSKTLRFDSADVAEMVGKTEGMALLGDGSLALINDDDFGITGARTQIVIIKGTDIARR